VSIQIGNGFPCGVLLIPIHIFPLDLERQYSIRFYRFSFPGDAYFERLPLRVTSHKVQLASDYESHGDEHEYHGNPVGDEPPIDLCKYSRGDIAYRTD